MNSVHDRCKSGVEAPDIRKDDEIVYFSWRHEVSRFDGDLVMLTDNEVLVGKHKILPTLCCGQGTAAKIVPTEEDIVNANIASFGNEVGQITNRVTAVYDVRSQFDTGSEEYAALLYRIQCGQKYQQDSIDYQWLRTGMCE